VTVRTFAWAHGEGEVQSLGAMLGPVRFRLPDGRVVQPFQVAPWADDAGADALPGILRRLRGEWPCVPFGLERDMDLSGDWADLPRAATDGGPDGGPAHGHGSNADWTPDRDRGDGVSLSIDYPPDSPVARLERHIRPDPDAPALDLDLTIHLRRDATLPIALHPTFRVPDTGVVIHATGGGMTFPAAVEPGVSALARGATFDRLDRVPLAAGGHADLTRLPLPVSTEELVQLTAPGGRVALSCPAEGWQVRLSWNADHFPGLVVWVSNRGRSAWPWSGRHQAVGLEPACAAFDLGPRLSSLPNPLSRSGHPTARTFRAGEVFTTALRIEAAAIAV
jgi:hypothetical protein